PSRCCTGYAGRCPSRPVASTCHPWSSSPRSTSCKSSSSAVSRTSRFLFGNALPNTAQLCTQTSCGVRFVIRVQPPGPRDQIVGLIGNAVKVQVTAAPVEGAANEAVVTLLARWLAVPRRAVAIVRGQTARDKLVEVASDRPAELAARIATLAAT